MLTGATMAMVTGLVLGGGLVVERFVMPRLVWGPYLRLGFPLGADLVAIRSLPAGQGQTPSVSWQARQTEVLFWVTVGQRAAPWGLHGVVKLLPRADGRVDLRVFWSPPWVAVLGCLWLGVLGLLRGEPHISGPISAVLLLALFIAYRQAALRAAAELRWALSQQDS